MAVIMAGNISDGYSAVGEVEDGVIYQGIGYARAAVAKIEGVSVLTMSGRLVGRVGKAPGLEGGLTSVVYRASGSGGRVAGYAVGGLIKRGWGLLASKEVGRWDWETSSMPWSHAAAAGLVLGLIDD